MAPERRAMITGDVRSMDRQNPSEEPARRKTGILSWPTATAFWAVISIVGWVAIAVLLTILAPGDSDKIATDKNEPGDIREIAPASGAGDRKAD
jgi:hypothetical protein